jgi:hypothetical protein
MQLAGSLFWQKRKNCGFNYQSLLVELLKQKMLKIYPGFICEFLRLGL